MSNSPLKSLTNGARRGPITSKQGNKNFYKGKGSGSMGQWTTRGNYIVQERKLRKYVAPEDISNSKVFYMDTTAILALCCTYLVEEHRLNGSRLLAILLYEVLMHIYIICSASDNTLVVAVCVPAGVEV